MVWLLPLQYVLEGIMRHLEKKYRKERKRHMKKEKTVLSVLMIVFVLMFSCMTTQAATIVTNKKLIQGQTWSPKVRGTKVKWKSSNKQIATVTSKGKIKVRRKGTVVITAKSGKNTYKYKIKTYVYLSKNQAQNAVLNYCSGKYRRYYCAEVEKKGNDYWVWINYGTGAQGKYVVNRKNGQVKCYEPYWGRTEDPKMPVMQTVMYQALNYL